MNPILKAMIEKHFGLLSMLADENAYSREDFRDEDEILSRQCQAALRLAEEGCLDPVRWREEAGISLVF